MLVRKDQIINLCEMKYTEASFSVTNKFIMNMNEKIKSFREKTKTKYAIHSTLVTTYPVIQNEYTGDLQAIITAEDLFTE